MAALMSIAAIANTVNTRISREAAKIHFAGAGDAPAGPMEADAWDRLAHAGSRRPRFRPVAAILTSCTGVLPACAAATDRVTAGSLSVGQQPR